MVIPPPALAATGIRFALTSGLASRPYRVMPAAWAMHLWKPLSARPCAPKAPGTCCHPVSVNPPCPCSSCGAGRFTPSNPCAEPGKPSIPIARTVATNSICAATGSSCRWMTAASGPCISNASPPHAAAPRRAGGFIGCDPVAQAPGPDHTGATSAQSAALSCNPAAPRFSLRCARLAVPGIGNMTGACCNNQPSASCATVTP